MANKKKEENNDLVKIKEELSDYIDVKVRKTFNEELDKSYKRLIREKNSKITFRNFIIILLTVIICFLVYILYDEDYFDKFFVNENVNKIEKIRENKKENVEEKDLDNLKEKYGYLIDNIYVTEKSKYLKDYYDGNLTNELKHYITLNNFNIESLTKEDEYNIILEEEFKSKYKKIFNDEFKGVNFDYNDNDIKFISKIKSYLSSKVIEKEDNHIKRDIIDIELDDDEIEITTVEGLEKDNKLYNILNDEEVSTNLDEMKDKTDSLNKLVYVFDSDKKLIDIKKD